jgi:hypothetical protein
MTDAQFFQLFGLGLFAIGVGMLSNRKFIKNIFQELEDSTIGTFYGGIISFAIGFLLVSLHNTWAADRSVIITLIGWLALIKGLLFLMFPKLTLRLYKEVDKYSLLISYSILVLGIVLLYLGFFA